MDWFPLDAVPLTSHYCGTTVVIRTICCSITPALLPTDIGRVSTLMLIAGAGGGVMMTRPVCDFGATIASVPCGASGQFAATIVTLPFSPKVALTEQATCAVTTSLALTVWAWQKEKERMTITKCNRKELTIGNLSTLFNIVPYNIRAESIRRFFFHFRNTIERRLHNPE